MNIDLFQPDSSMCLQMQPELDLVEGWLWVVPSIHYADISYRKRRFRSRESSPNRGLSLPCPPSNDHMLGHCVLDAVVCEASALWNPMIDLLLYPSMSIQAQQKTSCWVPGGAAQWFLLNRCISLATRKIIHLYYKRILFTGSKYRKHI